MKPLTLNQPAVYEIKIQAYLENTGKQLFEGLQIKGDPANSITKLTGKAADQAMLHGWLRQIANLGLPLLSVNIINQNK